MNKKPLKNKVIDKKLEQIIYVSWEESERGWGTRPDGCSMHLTREDYQKYLNNYWKNMPKEVPDEYERPAGNPIHSFVSKNIYNKIKKSQYGIRIYQSELSEIRKKEEIKYGKEKSGWIPV
jgi:predicted metal-dependent peptidase